MPLDRLYILDDSTRILLQIVTGSRMGQPTPLEGLVDLAQRASSDERALEHLLIELYTPIQRYLYRRCDYHGDAAETAKDLTQEVLIRVADSIAHCRAASDRQLLAWVLSIARRVAIDHLRAHRDEYETAHLLIEGLDESMGVTRRIPGVALDEDELSAADHLLYFILCSVADLAGPDASELLWLRLVMHASWAEVGAELSIPAGRAKRRYQRLQAALRAEVVRRIEALPDQDRAPILARLESGRVQKRSDSV